MTALRFMGLDEPETFRPALTAHRLEEGAVDIEEHMLPSSMRKASR